MAASLFTTLALVAIYADGCGCARDKMNGRPYWTISLVSLSVISALSATSTHGACADSQLAVRCSFPLCNSRG